MLDKRAADAANGVLGSNGAQSADLPRLMRQLNDAARSVRDLANSHSKLARVEVIGKGLDARVSTHISSHVIEFRLNSPPQG